MKLVYQHLERPIEFKENQVAVLALENPKYYQVFIEELLACLDGKGESFVLSSNGKIIALNKGLEMVPNVFNIELNSHKVLTKLYGEIETTAINEEQIFKTNIMKSTLNTYFVELLQDSDLQLTFDESISFINILKAINLKFDDDCESLNEKIIAYIDVVKKFLGIRILIFINLKSFLPQKELLEVYKSAAYCKLNLLLIENRIYDKIGNEEYYIVDKDLCEI